MEPASWSLHKAGFQLNSQIPLHSNSSTWATLLDTGMGHSPGGQPPRRHPSWAAMAPCHTMPWAGDGCHSPTRWSEPHLAGGYAFAQESQANDGAQGLGLWSHCIFRRYTASLPTSLSCISSVDKRRLVEETGCGDSVRGPGSGGTRPAGDSLEPVTTDGSVLILLPERAERRTSFERHCQCGGYTALLGGGHMPPSVMQIHSPRVPWHQEETTTPRGVHCPAACLVSLGTRLHNLGVPQAHHSRMLHLLACLPLPPWVPSLSLHKNHLRAADSHAQGRHDDHPQPGVVLCVWGTSLSPSGLAAAASAEKTGPTQQLWVAVCPWSQERDKKRGGLFAQSRQLWLFCAFTTWLTDG